MSSQITYTHIGVTNEPTKSHSNYRKICKFFDNYSCHKKSLRSIERRLNFYQAGFGETAALTPVAGMPKSADSICAEGRDRTGMRFPSLVFETSASAYSATSARELEKH